MESRKVVEYLIADLIKSMSWSDGSLKSRKSFKKLLRVPHLKWYTRLKRFTSGGGVVKSFSHYDNAEHAGRVLTETYLIETRYLIYLIGAIHSIKSFWAYIRREDLAPSIR